MESAERALWLAAFSHRDQADPLIRLYPVDPGCDG